jgi:hypothetical protein
MQASLNIYGDKAKQRQLAGVSLNVQDTLVQIDTKVVNETDPHKRQAVVSASFTSKEA